LLDQPIENVIRPIGRDHLASGECLVLVIQSLGSSALIVIITCLLRLNPVVHQFVRHLICGAFDDP
jgi:hypothetical protein